MTIKIMLGNVGSGKTAAAVRDMYKSAHNFKTYSNIKTTLKNQINISPSMIIKKELIETKKKRGSNEETPVYDYKLNTDYWKAIKDPINVALDEAHSIINSRRSMSKPNVIITDWMALIRRILGSNSDGMGELTLITQLPNRIDTIARDMATQVNYHVCHYKKLCLNCNLQWRENSDTPEKLWVCPRCQKNKIHKHMHVIEVYKFVSMDHYNQWKFMPDNEELYYDHYYITDIERYFPLYNTLQWDNLFGELY